MAMRYSSFSQWLSRTWLAFMDESQQYGNYHEIAALAAIQQPALIVFVGDHRQTPGGLSKGRAAAANRRKLLHRPLGLRALNRPGDYLPPARLAGLVARLWPDASQDGSPPPTRLRLQIVACPADTGSNLCLIAANRTPCRRNPRTRLQSHTHGLLLPKQPAHSCRSQI